MVIQEVEAVGQKCELLNITKEHVFSLTFSIMVDNGEVQYNPNEVRLVKHINDEPFIVLINVGSSHNFLSQEMVEKVNLQQMGARLNTTILLDDGIGVISCKVLQVLMRMQRVRTKVNFEV
jgi:hypothetical protein